MKRDRSTCIPLKITSKEYNIFPTDYLLSQGELAKKRLAKHIIWRSSEVKNESDYWHALV